MTDKLKPALTEIEAWQGTSVFANCSTTLGKVMTDAAFDLYGFWRSSATYRIRVALALKGITPREIPVDLEAGEQYSPAFLAINPQGALPALVEPGHPPLTQSGAILEYLEERFPFPPLLPQEPMRGLGCARSRSS